MSRTRIPAHLRQRVTVRARGRCEYCLIHEDDSYFGMRIDHIISEKHGGETEEDNLALTYVFCNRAKGSDVGSFDPSTGAFMRFFNPRIDPWPEHFRLEIV